MTYFVKRETNNTDDDLLWQLEGCVADMKIENLSRNGLPQISLAIQAANFRHGAQDGLANVALAVPEGQAQLAMGTNVRLLISPTASNASVEVDMASVALDIGVSRKPDPTQTERINRFDGLSSYSYDPSASTMTVTILDYTDDFYAALAANSTWRITLYQMGNGSGAGSAWCIHAPMARLIETPARADVEMSHGTTLKFQLCEPSDATPGNNENLEMSRLLIALA